MQHRKTLIASVSFLILAAGIAQADVTTFTGNVSNSWHDSGNWDNGIPGANDRAVIPFGESCNIISNAVADTIDVSGELVITGKLTLDNDTDNVSPTGADMSGIDGLVRFRGGILSFIDNHHGVSGSGRIQGANTTSDRIEIEWDVRLTNRLGNEDKGIMGRLTIQGLTKSGSTNGTFRNDGIVNANLSATLLLHGDTILEDHPTADQANWIATGCDSTLKFDRAASLEGAFNLVCGTFHFKESIRTCGTFTFDEGAITIDSGKHFAYKTYASFTSCANPENVTPSVRDCTVYEIDSSGSSSCGICCKD